LEVGLWLSVGQDTLGAKEVGEQSHLRESREEDRDPFVAEEAFAEDFDESLTLVGFVCGQIEQGGLTFGLSRGGLGAEGLLLGLIRDELAGEIDDVRTSAVSRLKVVCAGRHAQGVADGGFAGLTIEGLLQVEGDRDVTGGKAEQSVALVVEVLTLVDERDVQEGRRPAVAQSGQQSFADQAEIRVPLFIDRRWADEFDVA
jgi:hypothetical protein